jgi:hypothetical protein
MERVNKPPIFLQDSPSADRPLSWQKQFLNPLAVDFNNIHILIRITIIKAFRKYSMPKSRGRASRSESGTWRKEAAEDEKDERFIPEEETMVSPGAPVVARLRRGRRSKAEPSPSSAVVADGSYDKPREKTQSAAAGEPGEPNLHPIQERGGTPWNALSIAAAVIAFLCLFGLVSFGASPMHVADQASRPRSLAEASLGIDGFFDWFNNMPWTNRPGEAEKEFETVNSIQPVADEGSLWKSPDSACPQRPACDDSIVHATEQEVAMGRVKDQFPPVLALVTFRFPAISSFMSRLVKRCHDFIDGHLWVSSLWTACGAWKAMELLLALVRTAGGSVLDCAERIAERLRQDESIAKIGIDDDSEKARREAEQRLLLRMRVIEKEKE